MQVRQDNVRQVGGSLERRKSHMTSTKVRFRRTGIRLAVALGAVGPLLLLGAASVAASPEIDAPPDGAYLVTLSDGQTETWEITGSCGRGCALISSSNGWSKYANFIGGGYWGGSSFVVVVDQGPDAAPCPDGTKTVWNQSYSFSSVSLTGKKGLTKMPSRAGHGGVGENERPPSVPFTMTKTA
jgi:hypothetical protein